MARCIFENLTKAQAETMAHWFEGQGEQDMDEWFDIHEVPSFTVDVEDKECIKVSGDDVIVQCH